MSKAGGIVVRLSEERFEIFEEGVYESFSEPVAEFSHSRSVPLICFIVDDAARLTHVAQGKKGNRAGTDLRRLHLQKPTKLRTPIHTHDIVDEANASFQKKLKEKLGHGGLVPPGTFQEMIDVLVRLDPELKNLLSRYSNQRDQRINRLSPEARNMLGQQKEAVATALAISGINREELQGWDVPRTGAVSSYLDGLSEVRLREDQMLTSDLQNIPGYDILRTSAHGSVVFENENSKLTVTLANRTELEKLLGVDLIYFNETFSCFLMVQYKAMERDGQENVLRFPNKQLDDELGRMQGILADLQKCPKNSTADGFRLSENPFFLKICARLVFNPDDVSLVPGMYLPLDYWGLISRHASMLGPKGGKRLSYRNVRRYLDNTEFIRIASGAWVGTNTAQSAVLTKAIQSTLESGRAVVLAVNSDKDDRHRVD